MTLFTELRRRNVFRVSAAYFVTFWLVIQVSTTVAPALNLPDWVSTLVVWLGIVGFPFMLIFSWMYQLTPDGLQRDTGTEEASTAKASIAGRPLNMLITALLALSLVFVIVDSYLLEDSLLKDEAIPSDAPQAAFLQSNSIAVLPFANMSDDASQGYFSDGLSEELLNLLAKQRGLKVAARTSSFAFRDTQANIQEIAGVLQVAHVLEGSVRRSGNQIRITAQLINATDGYHLWSETYDRQLEDVFAVQDEIAAAIVSALSLHLDIPQLSASRGGNVKAYDLYLQGNELARKPNRRGEAYDLYAEAVSLDPTLAAAWAAKAEMAINLRASQFWDGIPEAEAVAIAEDGIQRALAIDPGLAEAHVAQSVLNFDRYRIEDALVSADLAIAANPNLANAYLARATVLRAMGYLQDGWIAMSTAIALDPLNELAVISRWDQAATVLSPEQLAIAEKALDVVKQNYGPEYQPRAEAFIRAMIDRRSGNDYARQYLQYKDSDPQLTADADQFIGILSLWEFNSPAINAMRSPDAYRMFLTSWRGRPDEALAMYAQLPPPAQQIPIVLEERSIAQINVGDCAGAMASLDTAHGAEIRIYGQVVPSSLRSNSNLALNRVFCWRQMGLEEEAEELLARVDEYVARLRNSAYLGYFTVDAKTRVLQGDREAAIDVLELAWKRNDLEFYVFADPVLSTLDGMPRFEQLRRTLIDHVNQERAKLGWDRVEL
jgi:TolB-like protein